MKKHQRVVLQAVSEELARLGCRAELRGYTSSGHLKVGVIQDDRLLGFVSIDSSPKEPDNLVVTARRRAKNIVRDRGTPHAN